MYLSTVKHEYFSHIHRPLSHARAHTHTHTRRDRERRTHRHAGSCGHPVSCPSGGRVVVSCCLPVCWHGHSAGCHLAPPSQSQTRVPDTCLPTCLFSFSPPGPRPAGLPTCFPLSPSAARSAQTPPPSPHHHHQPPSPTPPHQDSSHPA